MYEKILVVANKRMDITDWDPSYSEKTQLTTSWRNTKGERRGNLSVFQSI